MTIIQNNAFQYCLDLERVSIPSSVISIGQEAFFMSTIKYVDFKGATPPSIAYSAFHNAVWLQEVSVPIGSYNIYRNMFSAFSSSGVIMPQIKEKTEAYFDYRMEGNNAIVASYNGPGGVVNVPSTLGGHPVIAIGKYAFDYRLGIEEVTLPQGLVRIEKNAFQYCLDMERMTIPSSVTSIGAYAFYVNGIRSLEFKRATPPSFEAHAIYNCPSLSEIYVPAGSYYAYGVLNGLGINTSIIRERGATPTPTPTIKPTPTPTVKPPPNNPTYSSRTTLNLRNVASVPNTAQISSFSVNGNFRISTSGTLNLRAWNDITYTIYEPTIVGDRNFPIRNYVESAKAVWTIDYYTFGTGSSTFDVSGVMINYRYDKYEDF